MLLIKSFKSLLSIPGKSKQPGIQKLPFCHSLWFLLAEISVSYKSLSGHFHISQLFLLMVTVRTMVSMAGLWPGGRRKWAGGRQAHCDWWLVADTDELVSHTGQAVHLELGYFKYKFTFKLQSQVWCLMLVILALKRLRQEDHRESEVSLGYQLGLQRQTSQKKKKVSWNKMNCFKF